MTPQEILRKYFGYDAFRPGQEKLAEALISGRDALGVMPTGAGKSICYQVPALVRTGTALVVSPLISLMKDQVSALKEAGVPAAYLNSSLTPAQMDLAYERTAGGAYRVIYVAPERLDTAGFRRLCRYMKISLLAVDEAHCVSQWGQDFRPEYLHIADFAAALPDRPPVGAFTATATQRVREDIERWLGLRDPVRVTTGFDRPNLFFEVLRPRDRKAALLRLLEERREQTGIVYCATRKATEEICDLLTENGFSAGRYHAGLSDEERRRTQDDFRDDRLQVIAATNAFGMGIDKSNVHYVIHYNMPRSMEAYYQEAGRAGRDGEPAECILLYNGSDIFTARWMIENGEPNPGLTAEEAAAVKQRDHQRLQRMIDYCQTDACLRGCILRYFGEKAPDTCTGCSNCTGIRDAAALEPRRAKHTAAASLYGPASVQLPKPGSFAVAPPRRNGDTLFDALRTCRLKLARASGKPPFIICTDKTLDDMARRKPRTQAELLRVSGIGEAKAEAYGEAFLAAVNTWLDAHPEAGRSAKPAKPKQPASGGRPWLPGDDAALLTASAEKMTIADMASWFGRSENEILHRLIELKHRQKSGGTPDEEDLPPRDDMPYGLGEF